MSTTPHAGIAAIDPMSTLLPDDVYQKWVEMRHPHTPSIEVIGRFVKGLARAERAASLAKAREIEVMARAVIEAAR